MHSLFAFSELFGLEPVIAVRFNRLGWFFLNPMDLDDSGKNWVISLENAQKKGKKFSQFFSNEKNEMLDGIGFEELDYGGEEREIKNMDFED